MQVLKSLLLLLSMGNASSMMTLLLLHQTLFLHLRKFVIYENHRFLACKVHQSVTPPLLPAEQCNVFIGITLLMRNEVRKSGMNPIFKTSISQVFSGRYKRKIIVVDNFRLTSWFVYFDPVNGKLLFVVTSIGCVIFWSHFSKIKVKLQEFNVVKDRIFPNGIRSPPPLC